MFEKLRQKRLERRMQKDLYLRQEVRLSKLLDDLKPGTDEYKEIAAELRNNNESREKSRTSRGRASSGEKLGFWAKTMGVIGGLITAGSIIFAEHKGMTFTGEKRSVMDSISKTLGNIFFHRV